MKNRLTDKHREDMLAFCAAYAAVVDAEDVQPVLRDTLKNFAQGPYLLARIALYVDESNRIYNCIHPDPVVQEGPRRGYLYDFEGKIPPWTSYCRACLRKKGLDPQSTGSCIDATVCTHYPFKLQYRPKET